MIIIVMGLPGTGKTYFAEHLAAHIHATHISSDKTRNQLQKRGTYAPEDKNQVYQAMLERAKDVLEKGEDVIMDATYNKKAHRDAVMALGQKLNIPVRIIQLTADEKTVAERTGREREDSEADFEVYKIIKQSFELLEGPFLQLDSSKSNIDDMLEKAQHYLSSPM